MFSLPSHSSAKSIVGAMLIAICCTVTSAPAVAAEKAAAPAAKSLPGPTIDVDVTEWIVFVADVVNPELNSRSLFHDSLPPFAEDLRPASPAADAKPAEPGPVGVIRISPDGPIDKEGTIDVQLGFKGGACWAIGRGDRFARAACCGRICESLPKAANRAACPPDRG